MVGSRVGYIQEVSQRSGYVTRADDVIEERGRLMSNGSDSFQDRLYAFMRGRNGADELAVAIVAIAVVLGVIDMFVRWTPLTVVVILLFAYVVFRMFSTNLKSRRDENEAFVDVIGPVRPWLRNPRAAFAESRQYKHAACPNCHQRVRIPRGKGHVRVTCPQCKQKFDITS